MCGIELEPFQKVQATGLQPDTRPLRLIYVGRLDPLKGVPYTAIELLTYLRDMQDARKVQLTIVGVGHPEYERILRDLI